MKLADLTREADDARELAATLYALAISGHQFADDADRQALHEASRALNQKRALLLVEAAKLVLGEAE